ncbi:MAG: hypothetical protein COT81_00045 [Candidatus Buchananbacteria bacterium CG10_big_fil_rev_8_21_14_0_10_42_9]|uniref:Dephospho-CoA kinase n=1 Tax=Candidatus Buchananbacteria bacterium CG10_big_fil_rev_8_21_14_0_10_42_9 TaxID=1974526 RepID=A0A2H0W2N7_9BACT|nr:MAG: hypothetical protein COT81_00045 [Candidatus Buchananbacteria bacterium CG10_big_fil_rev_8_21_14_0_10_42_9]
MSAIVIGACGHIAAGKTTIFEHLEKNYDVDYARFSDPLRNIADILGIEKNRENLQKLSTLLRENFDQAFLSKAIRAYIDRSNHNYIYIDGIRRLPDITYLKDLPNFFLIAINADLKTRYERITTRNENPDDQSKTWEAFQAEAKQESELQINEVMEHAAFTVNNNGTIDEFYSQIDNIMQKINAQTKP